MLDIGKKVVFRSEAEIALIAAKEASKKIMEIYKTNFASYYKGSRDSVTQADLESNKVIHKILSTTHTILSEETTDTDKRLFKDIIWIVDPLDGTSDFIHRTGDFSILIGLVKNGESVFGLIYYPLTKEYYIAEKGQGSYHIKNKICEQIRVTSTNYVENANVIMSRSHLSSKEKYFLDFINKNTYSQKGSIGLKVADIASGSADIYFSLTNKIKQWDSCAANCIISEAGGKMTDMKGEKLVYNIKNLQHDNGILVTNGNIHNNLVKAYERFQAKNI